jgi:ABC-type transporter Mla MlaB component
MAAPAPRPVVFSVYGPIAAGDLPGLCDRVCRVLSASGSHFAVCEVEGVEPNAATVDALCRLQLAARRLGIRISLRGASQELRELIEFMGLEDVFAVDP